MNEMNERETSSLPILVVDDEPHVLEMVQMALGNLGYSTNPAVNISDASVLLRKHAYSLVICDYEMPGGSGLELLDYVSHVHPNLPFIMLTGHNEVELARQAIRTGAFDFVTKPLQLDQLARLIEQNKARVERDRNRAAQLTVDLLKGTIRALVTAIDAKDPYTAFHSARVTRIALHFGQELRLPADRLQVLEFASLLHDVGKIGVPDHILSKPGKLNEEEMAIVKRHPARSAEIVTQIGDVAEIAAVVRHHHEGWNGNGYPDGLLGEAIPWLSRLLTLADVYEALTADRSYRPAMTLASTLEIIREGLGTQFDPQLGERFLGMQSHP